MQGGFMENRPVLWVIGTRLLVPEMRDEFNRWYDEEHLPVTMGLPGMLRASRYERMPLAGEDAAPDHLVVYEFANEASVRASDSGPERQRVLEHRQGSWSGGAPFETVLKGHYRPIGPGGPLKLA
jgi:hypothetical protein